MRQVFSSDDLPSSMTPQQRAMAWADFLSSAGTMDGHCPNADGFRARSTMVALPGCVIGRAEATSIRFARTKRHIESNPTEQVLLLINDRNTLLGGSQCGREHVLRPGDAMLLNFMEPHQSHAELGGHAIGIHIPIAALGEDVRINDLLTGSRIDARSDALKLLRAYTHTLLEMATPQSPAISALSARHVAELATIAIRDNSGGRSSEMPEGDASNAARLALVCRVITDRCAEVDLDAVSVGKQLGISARTVQNLLQRAGTTFSSELREARLKRAFERLSNHRYRNLPIIAISQECGFDDLSTFYRAVSARFGRAPGQIRRESDADR